jgi:hypothetical protein
MSYVIIITNTNKNMVLFVINVGEKNAQTKDIRF